MKIFNRTSILLCGLLLMLVAFPVFAQDESGEVKINDRYLLNFISQVKEKISKNEVDLTKPFSISLEATLSSDGKFDPKTTRFVKIEGDPKTVEIAKSFIEAVNGSGSFRYLRNVGMEKIKLAVVQNDDKFYADIVSEQNSSERADTITSGFNTLIRAVHLLPQNGLRKLSDNEKTLFEGMKANSEGNNVTLKFAYQKSVIQEMINRNLKENEKSN